MQRQSLYLRSWMYLWLESVHRGDGNAKLGLRGCVLDVKTGRGGEDIGVEYIWAGIRLSIEYLEKR